MAQNQNNPPVISFGFYLFCLLIGVIFLGAACLLLPVLKDLKNQEKIINYLNNTENPYTLKAGDMDVEIEYSDVKKVARHSVQPT